MVKKILNNDPHNPRKNPERSDNYNSATIVKTAISDVKDIFSNEWCSGILLWKSFIEKPPGSNQIESNSFYGYKHLQRQAHSYI